MALILLSSRSLSLLGDSFIRLAMTLVKDYQWEIRDMIAGLLEPGQHVTDAVLTQLLCTARGLIYSHCLITFTADNNSSFGWLLENLEKSIPYWYICTHMATLGQTGSFVIFDIRALWSECPDVKTYK